MADGGRPLPLDFDWLEQKLVPIGINAKLVPICVANHIKHTVPPNYKDWDQVLVHYKEQLMNTVEILKLKMMYFYLIFLL